jgi:hypothetical protein
MLLLLCFQIFFFQRHLQLAAIFAKCAIRKIMLYLLYRKIFTLAENIHTSPAYRILTAG